MVHVIRAEKLGFCSGANRAYEMAKKYPKAYILGDVVHNKQVMEWLAKRDKIVIDGVDDDTCVIPNKDTIEWLENNGKDINQYTGKVDRPVIITAHGALKGDLERLQNLGIELKNTTCKKVELIYKKGIELENSDYQVAIYGDKNHPEVKGIASYLKNPIFINSKTLKGKNKFPEAVGIICQSTSIRSEFEKVSSFIKNNISRCKIVDTICPATANRQMAAKALSKKSNLILVIGGEHSSNTNKLKEICEYRCETHHVQTPNQLEASWFRKKEIIGITAGASTPEWIIKGIEDQINSIVA